MTNLRAEATNPAQYEEMNVDWQAEGDYDAPFRAWMREYLEPITRDLQCDTMLDVGCGTGWLSRVMQQCPDYTGIDPSAQNIDAARHLYPSRRLIKTSFEDFDIVERYDMSSCIMATEHIDNLDLAFQKWHRLIRGGGKLLIIHGDKEAFTMPRFDYTLTVEPVSEDEAIVQNVRPRYPSTTDIVRSVRRFETLGTAAGFTLIDHQEMVATDSLISARPEYEIFCTSPIFHLLEFHRG